MQVGRSDVHPAPIETLALGRRDDRQTTASAEDLSEQTGPVIGRVLYHEQRGRQIAGQAFEQLPNCLDPSHRGADDDHVTIPTFGSRRAGGHCSTSRPGD
jgi:hypothetical protein